MTGAIVLATEQGLGYLAKDFYDNGVIDIVYVQQHGRRKTHFEWFPNRVQRMEDLLDKCDKILMFETPFDWTIIPEAKKKGIKTILMPMYECTNHPMPFVPDLIIAPSLLDQDYYPGSELVQVPVTANWRERTKANIFVHNAGNGGLGGRNGTKEIIEAMKYVDSPIKLIIRSQKEIEVPDDDRIDLRIGTFDDIWDEGDVFLFPEKFNGLSLPLQEAYASGFLVMAGDRYPVNDWLPNKPLIPVEGYHQDMVYQKFNVAEYNPRTIARKIDEWYGKDISEYSLMGKKWGEDNSWGKLLKTYKQL